ncbi:MAG: MFS transporter [Oscillospiraceae bacterium]|nr:MFS transporter [Oscillospiraceae bacterium]
MNKTARKSSWYGPKQVVLMIFLGIMMLFASCVVGGSTNTVLPAISEQLGWDVAFLRSMAGVGAIMVVVGNFVFGNLTKAKGPKISNFIGLIGMAIFMILYGWTHNLKLFIACILIMGFFSGTFNCGANHAHTANWWPTKKGVVLGYTTIGIVLMDLVWQPFAPKWFASIGIGWTMTIFAIIVIIVAILYMILTKNTPEEAGEYPDGDAEHAEDINAVAAAMRAYKSPFTLGKTLATPSTWTIGLGMGLMRMVNLAFVASIVPRLLHCGYPYPLTVTLLMVGGVVGIFGSALIGILDQKIGTKKAIFVYAGVFLAAMIVALFHAQSIVCVWISSIIIMAVCGGTANLIPSAVIKKFGRWDFPAVSRIVVSLGELGAGVGIMLTGVFHDYQKLYYFGIVAIVVGIIHIACTKFDLIGKEG